MNQSSGFKLHVLASAAALLVTWYIGTLIYWPHVPTGDIPIAQKIHLAIVLAISISVILSASKARGSFDDRLGQTLVSATILFGSYAVIILIGRQFFSRTVLSTIIPATIFVSLATIWIRSRNDGVKAIILTPLVRSIPPAISSIEQVDSPSIDFRPFDIILVDLHRPINSEWASALSRAMLCGSRIMHIENYIEEINQSVSIAHFELEHIPATNKRIYTEIKRLIDIVGALAILPIALPVVLLSAFGVVLLTGWPAFYVSQRVGLGGSQFKMWKLRTMHNADTAEITQAAIPGDTRVTSIGRILRRSRIDELPQLWNVIRGDMSLIGPRPEATSLHLQYVSAEPKFAYRTLVRPGMTGWAQVNAPPSANAEEAIFKVQYDLFYIKNQSAALDFRIFVATFWTVLAGSGVR